MHFGHLAPSKSAMWHNHISTACMYIHTHDIWGSLVDACIDMMSENNCQKSNCSLIGKDTKPQDIRDALNGPLIPGVARRRRRGSNENNILSTKQER